MKLVISIVQDEDAIDLVDNLTEAGFSVTKLATTGGFLKQGNTTVLVGVEKDKVEEVIKIVKENCAIRESLIESEFIPEPTGIYMPYPLEVKTGGATVFVLDVDDYYKF